MVERDSDRPGAESLEALDEPNAPASAEEVAAAKRLRDALEGTSACDATSPEATLALALRAAWDPSPLAIDESRALLDATPYAEEQCLAALLRDALAERREPRANDTAGVHLAHALRAAFAPPTIDANAHRAILDAALAKVPPRSEASAPKRMRQKARSNVIGIAFAVGAAGLALAATLVLVMNTAPLREHEAPLATVRTTQPLFSEPFKPGEASARIDRIASARASDFRDNRFTMWGVR